MAPANLNVCEQHDRRIEAVEGDFADLKAEVARNSQRLEDLTEMVRGGFISLNAKLERVTGLEADVKDLQASRKRWSRVVVWAGSGIGTVAVGVLTVAAKSWLGL